MIYQINEICFEFSKNSTNIVQMYEKLAQVVRYFVHNVYTNKQIYDS